MNLKEKVLLFIEKYKTVLITLIFILFFLSISKQFFYFKEIKNNKKETIGVVSKQNILAEEIIHYIIITELMVKNTKG